MSGAEMKENKNGNNNVRGRHEITEFPLHRKFLFTLGNYYLWGWRCWRASTRWGSFFVIILCEHAMRPLRDYTLHTFWDLSREHILLRCRPLRDYTLHTFWDLLREHILLRCRPLRDYTLHTFSHIRLLVHLLCRVPNWEFYFAMFYFYYFLLQIRVLVHLLCKVTTGRTFEIY